ncbi:MAG: RNA polymerase sigma factor [Planctomycetota bacterium]
MFNDSLDRERMQAVKAGDKAALEQLYGAYAKPLISFFFRLTWDRTQSEDLLQETFLRLWKSAAFYRGDSKVSTYIFQIAKNLAFSNQALARNRHEKTAPDPHAGDDPAARESHASPTLSVEKDELRRIVRAEVDGLPEPQRLCVILAQFEDLKHTDIAQILGVPVGTVKSRLFNAEQTLRRRLGRYLEGDVRVTGPAKDLGANSASAVPAPARDSAAAAHPDSPSGAASDPPEQHGTHGSSLENAVDSVRRRRAARQEDAHGG